MRYWGMAVSDSVRLARRLGWQLVILVGDPAYYEPFGFTRGPVSGLWLPGPVEQRRFLGLDLEPIQYRHKKPKSIFKL